MTTTNLIEVMVQLLDEGTVCFRPTKAKLVTLKTAELLPTENYDPKDENWEFKPGTIVGLGKRELSDGRTHTVAVKPSTGQP